MFLVQGQNPASLEFEPQSPTPLNKGSEKMILNQGGRLSSLSDVKLGDIYRSMGNQMKRVEIHNDFIFKICVQYG